jgi:paraquat-inducible protein A
MTRSIAIGGQELEAEGGQLVTHAHLRECNGCGLFQTVPALPSRSIARCERCNTILRRTHDDTLGRGLAMNVAAFCALGIACLTPLMDVSTAGMHLSADLFSGPEQLQGRGVWELAWVVLFTTVAAPLFKFGSMIYVLAGLRMEKPPLHLRQVFAWNQRLRPWAMTEVYLLGVFVAYVKLVDMVQIDIGVALYALGILMLMSVAADAVLDRQAVWEAMRQRHIPDAETGADAAPAALVPGQATVGCETCGLVSELTPSGAHRCRRCGSSLHVRKPNSIARTWALVIAALVLYVPANLYPVLTVMQLGAGSPSTILGGVEELLASGMYPLAALVFFASILVPVLKLTGLLLMLLTTQYGLQTRLRDRTLLYRIVSAIGRWSMIDIFMESILVALVRFGVIVTIEPGGGAIAFAGVVIITMFAAEGFDPRLMWDAAMQSKGVNS